MMTQVTMSHKTQAEALIVELDAVQSELETATTRELFESCKVQLVAIKAEIEAIGYQVQRAVCGWKLVEPVVEVAQVASPVERLEKKYLEKIETWAAFMGRDMAVRQYGRLYAMSGIETFFAESEIEMNAKISARSQATEYRVPSDQYPAWEALFVEQYSAAYRKAVADWKARKQEKEVAQAASTPTVELHEDEMGLYAEVPASTGKGAYTVRVCAKWLYSTACDCPSGQHGKDCKHRVQVDRAFDSVRPSFSEQCKGKVTSPHTIARLVRDRKREVAMARAA